MLDLAIVVITHRGRIDSEVLDRARRLGPAELHVVSSGEGGAGRLSGLAPDVQVHHLAAPMPPGQARNYGASESKATNLLFVDDDVWIEDSATAAVREFVAGGEAEIVGGLYEIVRNEPVAQVFQNAFLAYRFDECQAGRQKVLSSSHLLMRRTAFDRVGGFHPSMTSQEDLELCSRAIHLGVRTGLDRRLRARHRRSFSALSLVRDYLVKAQASIGFRLSHRRAMEFAGNNLTAGILFSWMGGALALGILILLLASRSDLGLGYALAAGLWGLSVPWPFLNGRLRDHRRAYLFGLLCWPWIGLAVSVGSAAGSVRWLLARLLALGRSWLDYLIVLKRVLIRTGRPVQLIAYVTASCNLRCSHCFYKETLDSPDPGELDLEVFDRLIHESRPLLWFSLGGGEPVLRKDLLELSRRILVSGRPKIFSFPTNGWYVEKTFLFVLRLLQSVTHGTSRVVLFFSLDGPREIHDRIRGEGSYQRVLETVDRLRPLERWYPHFRISVVTTITPENASQAGAFVEQILRGIKPAALSINLFRYHALEHPPLEAALLDGYEEALRVYERFGREERRSGYGFWADRVLRVKDVLQKEIILRVARQNEFVTPCTAGELSYVVMEDGRLKSCEILEDELGDVARSSFSDLIATPEAKRLRRWIRDTECRCTYECAQSTNALFSWPMTFRLLKSVLLNRDVA